MEKHSSKKVLIRIAFVALFAALTALGTFISIPIGPIPIVLQNMFAVLSGLILGPLMGGAATALFLLAGILNFPVFSGGTGGISHFFGPTGGYLVGYLLASITAGLITGSPARENSESSPILVGSLRLKISKTLIIRLIIAVAAAFIVIYIPGLYWLKISRNLDWQRTLVGGLYPFIPGDILKAIVAVLIAPRLRRIARDFLNG